MGCGLCALGAFGAAGLEHDQRQWQSGKGTAMAFAAAHRILQESEALEVRPSKAGKPEFCR
jgi:hypothetical protein